MEFTFQNDNCDQFNNQTKTLRKSLTSIREKKIHKSEIKKKVVIVIV